MLGFNFFILGLINFGKVFINFLIYFNATSSVSTLNMLTVGTETLLSQLYKTEVVYRLLPINSKVACDK